MTLRPEVPNTPANSKKKKTLETAKRKDLKKIAKKGVERERQRNNNKQ